MTEARPKRGIDPRFDPRFQRDYVADASAAHDEAPAQAELVPPPSASPEPPQPSTQAWVATTRTFGASAPGSASRPMPAADDVPPAVDAVDPDDPELLSVFDEPDDEPSPIDPWFLAAWAVAVLAVIIGSAFWWAGIMAENPFSGPSESDRWLQYVGWVVAPALVQGGLMGIVAMLVWTGIRWARRHRESS